VDGRSLIIRKGKRQPAGFVVNEVVPANISPDAPTPRTARSLLLLLIGMALGFAADRFLVAPKGSQNILQSSAQAVPRAQAPFSRIGNRIIVPPDSLLRSQLVVTDVAAKELSRSLVLPAMVEADPARTVKVLPPVTGRVVELKVQLGERVAEGQELAIIDSGDLAQAYSDVEKAQSAAILTKKTLDRQLGLLKIGGGAIKEREQAESDYAQAEAELERARTRLRSMGVSAEQIAKSRLLTVKAPVAGSLIDLQIAPGAFLNDMTAAAMTIANLDTIWVTANVPEKDISFVFTGQTVSVTFPAYPNKVFSGKVLFVSDVIEPDTRRNKVRIAFDNPDRMMKPNMFANATFLAPPVSRPIVPTSALLMTNDKTSVFVEVAEWAFERRDVEVAYQEGATAAVKAGLKPGERIVVKGAVRLND
jgi:membrane fusion protein, heavy metal efflux system